MAILGRITVNGKDILEVSSIPSSGLGTPAPVGSTAMLDNGSDIGTYYLKIGPLDTDWDTVATLSTGNVGLGNFLRLPIYNTNATGYTVDDVVTQNSFGIDVAIQAQPTRSAAIEYRIPNPGDAISAVDFLLSEGAQTVNGLKTFNDGIVVNGTLAFINTTNLEVTDKLIRINKGGAAGSAGGAGIEVEENTPASVAGVINASTGWASTALGTLGNGQTVTIIDSGIGGLALISDNGTAVTIDLGGSTPTAATVNSLVGLTTVTMTGAGTLTLAEGPLTTANGVSVTGYWKVSANRQGWDSLVGANPYVLSLNQNSLSANRTQNYANTSGTFVMRPDGTPGVSGQIAYWQDANNLVSAAGFTYVAGVFTVPNITISSLGAGVVHSSAAGVLSSSSVVLTSEVSGILPVANGGTNSSTALNNGRLMYSNGGAVVEYTAMVPNQVYFGAASTGLPAQSVNLFWDITNSRLGIGTATPSRSLHVAGSSLFNAPIRFADTAHPKANWEVFEGSLQTTNATPATAVTIALAADTEYLIEARIMGRNPANGNSAAYVRTARYKNVGGTCTINTLQADYTSEDIKAWDGTLAVNGTDAVINVTGGAYNVDWTVIYFVQVLA
jgi:hypothetical protein